MAFLTRLPALSLFSAFAVATPFSPFKHHRDLRVHETRDLPIGFSLSGPAAPSTSLSLRIALSNADPSAVVDALQTVSNPTSDKYGQYLSKAQADQLSVPSSDALSAVNAWLQEHGFTSKPLTAAGDWIQVTMNVSQANTLLAADFSMFSHSDSGMETLRTLSYSIPSALKGHIDLIHPTTVFPDPVKTISLANKKREFHSAVASRASTSQCLNGTTPACLQELYNIPLTPAKVKNNTMAVTGHFGNNAHYAFLETFLKTYRPDMDPATNFSVTLLDGGNNDQDVPSVSEGELDIQYTIGLATEVPVDYVMVGIETQDGDLEGYLDEINYLLSLEHPPQVLTTSYGFTESSLSFALTDKMCKAYAQLGARGVSILFASGDSGAGCTKSNNNTAPTFPSNCPYVTSVGGTEGHTPETAWAGSSGGFSNYFPTPAYQAPALSAYLSAHGHASSAAGRFNASGRGFPDVAAKADDFRIALSADGSSSGSVYGTSAASPTFASVVALLNDRLAQVGRPPLGFLNPWLYGAAKGALNDITAGNNSVACNGEKIGFAAVEGWDPVTGLGTPDFEKLLKLVGL